MKNPAVIDAYLGAHHDVDLGDTEGIKELAAELVADQESIVGTEDAGIIAVDVVAPEFREQDAGVTSLDKPGSDARGNGTGRGKPSVEDPSRREKDAE
jgi:hypothetical protein